MTQQYRVHLQPRGFRKVLEKNPVKPALSKPPVTPKVSVWKQFQRRLPLCVLALGLMVTTVTTTYFSRTAEMQDQLLFENEVARAKAEIESRLATYTALLRASRALFNANPEVSDTEFQAFVQSLDLRQRYPGLQSVGYVQRVADENLLAFTENMRANGQLGFNVFPTGPRPEYYPITRLAPWDERNRAALGFDMYSEAVRRAAMQQAAAEGILTASGKITPLIDLGERKQAVIILYLPVYDTAEIPATPAARQAMVRGFVSTSLRVGDFLQSTLERVSLNRLQVEVFDGQVSKETALRELPPVKTAHFTTIEQINVGGRQWIMRCESLPTFEAQSRRAWTPFLGVGQLATTLLLFGLAYAETRARVRAETTTQELHRNQAERERLLAREQTARATAEAANRAKDEFLAIVSHELRTPLNTLSGWVRMLRSRTLNDVQREQALAGMERNIRTQTHLTEDLLDVTHLQAGQFRLTLQTVDVVAAVEPVLAEARLDATAKDVALMTDIAPDVGTITADGPRVQQILANLLMNAIKFTPAGGQVSCRVRRLAATEEKAESVEFMIADTGKGIAAEFLPHVFESFRQEDNATTRGYGGLGLGLAIANRLCQLHGGSILAQSDGPQKGSRFIFTLPV